MNSFKFLLYLCIVYLTEERKFNSKYLMETLRGRLSYILTEALRDKNGNRVYVHKNKSEQKENCSATKQRRTPHSTMSPDRPPPTQRRSENAVV